MVDSQKNIFYKGWVRGLYLGGLVVEEFTEEIMIGVREGRSPQ